MRIPESSELIGSSLRPTCHDLLTAKFVSFLMILAGPKFVFLWRLRDRPAIRIHVTVKPSEGLGPLGLSAPAPLGAPAKQRPSAGALGGGAGALGGGARDVRRPRAPGCPEAENGIFFL